MQTFSDNWTTSSITDLLDCLKEQHHTMLKKDMAAIEKLIHDAINKHQSNHGLMLKSIRKI
ncbi:MAG: hypothetical protein A2Y10_04530 [Planctomycetes bacterium GWF2_41_51]|nr:MAG: hypothetical protein A2Y10_04530 [Planctomycetes bacterium GWF2_41_51]